jgi:DNA modification methylase
MGSAGMTTRIITGDCLDVIRTLPDQSVNCCVTSPPYWGLRDYGVAGQLGLEPTPQEYVEKMVAVFREVRRVLRDDGTLWCNMGDTYGTGTTATRQAGKRGIGVSQQLAQDAVPRAGGMAKQLLGIPWKLAFALQADGWYLRQDIIWAKPNPMPESVRDRCTKSHEYLFLLAKSERYYFDADAIKEPSAPASAPRRLRADLRLKEGYAESHFGNPPIRAKERSDGSAGTVAETGNDNCGTREHLRGELEGCAGDSGSGGDGRPSGDSNQLIRSKRDSFKREAKEDAIPGQAALQHREGRAENGYSLETRNKRSVWTVTTQPFKEAHFATFPPKLIEPCILAGCPEGGTVWDPFGGAGTTGLVADRFQRNAILIELNPEYAAMAEKRIHADGPLFAEVTA